MEPVKVKIIILGNSGYFFSIRKILKHKSFLYKIVDEPKYINNLPDPNQIAPTLEQRYFDVQLVDLIGRDNRNDFLTICIINCELENNFYLRRIGHKTAVLSICHALEILPESKISIENFIIKNIYEMALLCIETNYLLASEEADRIRHRDVRKCLYDLNGSILTIRYNTERPTICSECAERIDTRQLPKNFLNRLKKELLKIDKSIIQKIELLIKKYPLFFFLVSILFGVTLNIISNLIFNLIVR